MQIPPAFWHRESFDRFTHERLPALLGARLPLTGYRVADEERSTHITVTLADAETTYTLLRADVDGLFHRFEHPWIVVPLASSEDLATADITCVGEQLTAVVDARLGEIAANLPWDAALIRAVLPLEEWVDEVINPTVNYDPFDIYKTGQWLDITNRLAMITHQRRIIVPERQGVFSPEQLGRVCPFETPEGPNLGRVFSLAAGAVIRDSRIVIEDAKELLGPSASMLPFLEHNEPNHVIFATNMQRQWLPPLAPEPALVRTGNEPDIPGIWCGYNLLTAIIAGDSETYEDAILISESCAARLQYAIPVEAGDKWSNRHGLKGVISRIAPDTEMPRLPDGTPVELVFSAAGVLSRQALGMAREAIMSRIAMAEGQPAIVPPYGAPSTAELRARLAAAGLPEDGLETLTLDSAPLSCRACVGWVYWGRTVHTASDKLRTAVRASERAASQGELEYLALRDIGAWQTILETFNTRSIERLDSVTLAERVAAGTVRQAPPPSPRFTMLQQRLAAVGIVAEFTGDRVAFRFSPGDGMPLALPMPHPWSSERELTAIGEITGVSGWTEVADANARLARLREKGAPDSLVRQVHARLAAAVRRYADQLITPKELRPFALNLFGARTVLAPSHDLSVKHLGVPEEIAEALFRPVARGESLDAVMARSWIILNRAPSVLPTSLLAFRPVYVPGRAIRLPILACMLLNADFDGDQAAVFLPVTNEGQREAGEKLTVAAHLRRNPSLIRWLCPYHQAMLGLAQLSLTAAGQTEIATILGHRVAAPEGYVTRVTLTEALAELLTREGAEAAITATERLTALGLTVSRKSGASQSPFFGETLALPPVPDCDDPAVWQLYAQAVSERLAASNDFASADVGPALLAVKSGARGSIAVLQRLLGPIGSVTDSRGATMLIRHGYREGLTRAEHLALVPGTRERLAAVLEETSRQAYGLREASGPRGFTVLSRAMRAAHPGPVFAHAAAIEEVDPLVDTDSRLFVGLLP